MVSSSDFSRSWTAVLSSRVMLGSLSDPFEQDGVEDEGVSLGVAVHVLDEDFIDHAAFAGPAVVVSHVGGGAEDPEADLAGGIAAEHRAVLDEHDLESGAGGGDGAANA